MIYSPVIKKKFKLVLHPIMKMYTPIKENGKAVLIHSSDPCDVCKQMGAVCDKDKVGKCSALSTCNKVDDKCCGQHKGEDTPSSHVSS